MPRFFTVRWPLLARIDAVLAFPLALILVSRLAPVRQFINYTLAPAMPSFIARAGLSKETLFWAEMALICVIPFLLLLVLADRLLTVRKGFAVLSAVAIAAWCAAAVDHAKELAALVPGHIAGEVAFMAVGRNAAYAVAGVGILLHLWPLWMGLRDRGEVAVRVIGGDDVFGPRRNPRTPGDNTNYRRRATDHRWKPEEEHDDYLGIPKESRGLKFMFGLAWVGVMIGLGYAYFHWSSWGSGGRESRVSAPMPGLLAGLTETRSGPPADARPAAPDPLPAASSLSIAAAGAPPPQPVAAAPDRPMSGAPRERVVAAAAMPSVQRPSEVAVTLQPGSAPNQAVAERGRDGGFAFDAMVNGARASMLFDTGASVVALRAEEAWRFGISPSSLNYSAKVKTANGTADVAPVTIDTLTIGNITQVRVAGYVAREGMLARNLLGQTFLARLAGYNVENNRLVLKGP